jgi:phage terminase large subunit-like protein
MTQPNLKPSQQSLRQSLGKTLQDGLTKEAQRLSTSGPVEWIEDKFYIPETMEDPIYQGKIFLQPYQRDTLREAFRKDPETGLYVYSTIVWTDIKKSAKSSICAGVSLYIGDNTPWAENYHIANDLKQADTRVGKYARRAIDLSPYLKKRFRKRGYQILHRSNGSVLESIPIDPEGEAGSNADFIQFSELWGAMDDKKSRMWSEMRLSPTKFGKSLIWVESYGGYQDESEILWDLYDLGVLQGELVWPDKDYHVNEFFGPPAPLELYKNEEARQLTLWNTKPRCPWQTYDYYEKQERPQLLDNEFRRVHRNEWVTKTETYIPIEWYDAGKRDHIPKLERNQSMIIAMDAATSDDTFGVIMVTRHPDRKEYGDTGVVLYARRWKPPGKKGKIDFEGTDENPGPKKEVRRLCRNYNVVEVAYDPTQLHDPAMMLQKELGVNFRAFAQGGGKHSRLWADSDLRQMLREKRIWHTGLPHLREHLQNADAEIDKQERKVRIVKRTKKLKVDLAVCLSMAMYEVFRLNI